MKYCQKAFLFCSVVSPSSHTHTHTCQVRLFHIRWIVFISEKQCRIRCTTRNCTNNNTKPIEQHPEFRFKNTTRTTAKLSVGLASSLHTYTSHRSSTHKDPTSSIPAVSWETLLSDLDSCFDSFSLLSGSNLGRMAQGNRMRDARRDAVCAFDLTLIPWCSISLEVWFSLSGWGTTFPRFSSFHLKTNSLLFFIVVHWC